MADTVRVQFSASIGALINGVEDAKKAIESVRGSVDRVTEGAMDLLKAFGLAFSAERIIDFVGQMAEAGEQIERMSAMLGASTKQIQELGFIAKMTGGDADSMSLAMQRFELNLQRAQNSTSQQALALKALGLSAKDLIGIPLEEQMNRIADAVAKFADGGNKTAIVMALMGRSGAQMIPVLDQGRQGLESLRQQADDTGAVMGHETVQALADLNSATGRLKASLTGLTGTLIGELAPALTRAIDGFREWAAAQLVLVDTGKIWQSAIQDIEYMIASLALSLVHAAQIARDFFKMDWGAIRDDWNRGEEEQQALLKQHNEKTAELVRQGRAELANGLGAPESGNKPQAPALAVPNTDALKAATSKYEEMIKLAGISFQQTQERLSSEYKLHQITYDQENAALVAALNARHAAETAAIDGELSLYAKGTAGYQKALNERQTMDAKYFAELQKLQNQKLQQDAKDWQSALQPIQSAFDSQLKGLLAGTTTWAQAMKAIFADLVLDVIKELEKIAIEKAALGLASGLGGGPLGLLGGLIGLGSGGHGGGDFPSFDVGSYSVPRDMVAQVHAGEMIVPAQGGLADALRGMMAGGGNSSSASFNFNGPIIGTQAWLNSVATQLSRIMQQRQALTPSAGWA